ncbi:hypothetical protein BSZ35_13725 [Salinibacter sp. 10B]|nr:hypothetical protein BSZ35_13725 [Salinibacter sp. 10B]
MSFQLSNITDGVNVKAALVVSETEAVGVRIEHAVLNASFCGLKTVHWSIVLPDMENVTHH